MKLTDQQGDVANTDIWGQCLISVGAGCAPGKIRDYLAFWNLDENSKVPGVSILRFLGTANLEFACDSEHFGT